MILAVIDKKLMLIFIRSTHRRQLRGLNLFLQNLKITVAISIWRLFQMENELED